MHAVWELFAGNALQEAAGPLWREDGGWQATPVYRREALPEGAAFDGPAIVAQFDSTTVVEPGQSARLDDFGNLVITVPNPFGDAP